MLFDRVVGVQTDVDAVFCALARDGGGVDRTVGMHAWVGRWIGGWYEGSRIVTGGSRKHGT